MINVSSSFKTLSGAEAREVDCKIEIGSAIYTSDSIISCKIYRSIGDSGMAIGNTISDHITVQIVSPLISSGNAVKVYVRFGAAEWLQLGIFYVTQSAVERGTCEFEAYDMMYMLDKRCTFQGSTGMSLSALEFPATMQDMLDYICTLRSITCNFECQPFEAQSRPTFDADAYGDNKYYTQRDIISFIASAHGANAKFNNTGELVFSAVGQSAETINATDCISQIIDHEEGFTVNGIRFIVGEDEIFINDDGSVYSDDLEGIIQIDNPLASIEIAEYVWNQLGGFTYYTCSLERRGRGYYETGDVITVNGNAGLYSANIVIQSLEQEISPDAGFIERIYCEAETSTESANRGASGATSSPSSMAVYYGVNGSAVTIPSGTGTMRQINAINFAAKVNCVPLYATTAQLAVTTAGTVKLYLVYDSNVIATYRQYCSVGDHTVAITRPLLNVANGTHTIALFIASDDAEGTADTDCFSSVSGSGLATEVGWDGTVTVAENISGITLSAAYIHIGAFAETVSTGMYIPFTTALTESISGHTFPGTISLPTIVENAAFSIEDVPVAAGTDTFADITISGNISIGNYDETITTTEV